VLSWTKRSDKRRAIPNGTSSNSGVTGISLWEVYRQILRELSGLGVVQYTLHHLPNCTKAYNTIRAVLDVLSSEIPED